MVPFMGQISGNTPKCPMASICVPWPAVSPFTVSPLKAWREKGTPLVGTKVYSRGAAKGEDDMVPVRRWETSYTLALESPKWYEHRHQVPRPWVLAMPF